MAYTILGFEMNRKRRWERVSISFSVINTPILTIPLHRSSMKGRRSKRLSLFVVSSVKELRELGGESCSSIALIMNVYEVRRKERTGQGCLLNG